MRADGLYFGIGRGKATPTAKTTPLLSFNSTHLNTRHHGKSDLSRLEDFENAPDFETKAAASSKPAALGVPSNSNTACEYPDDTFPKPGDARNKPPSVEPSS
jgi:hypothetical protein